VSGELKRGRKGEEVRGRWKEGEKGKR